MIHGTSGPREAVTNETSPKNKRLHLRTRFRALEVVDQPRVRGEPRRSGTEKNLMRRLVIIAAFIVSGTTYADDVKAKFPAEMHVVSQGTDDEGRLRIRVRLLIDDHVAVYANPVRAPGMDHASVRITVLDAEKKPLRSNVTYPAGDKIDTEFMGDWYLYRNSVDIDVVLRDNPPLPLFIRAKIAGYNERGSYCLGFGEIETKLKPESEKSEP